MNAVSPTRTTGAPSPAPSTRRPWHPPALEPLGPWRALTLQQSIPIGPGNSFLGPRTDGGWLA